ncbi:MAG TPA: sulfur carrier protein ThiS [Desulfosarcina sp.]|nr:sulfur carrier protein ThiS [Desulfosarcina sp.]
MAIYLNEQEIPWHAGMTVASLLDQLDDGHRYAVVKLDGRLISRPRFAATPVSDGARVTLIPMIAGG